MKKPEPRRDLPQLLRIGIADYKEIIRFDAAPTLARLGCGRCGDTEKNNEKYSTEKLHGGKLDDRGSLLQGLRSLGRLRFAAPSRTQKTAKHTNFIGASVPTTPPSASRLFESHSSLRSRPRARRTRRRVCVSPSLVRS